MTPAALAATIDVPTDHGAAAMPCIVRDGDGWAVAWMLNGGREKRAFASFPPGAEGREQASALLRAIEARQ